MSEMITVGDTIARTLGSIVEAIYGVISIHNLPIRRCVGQREKIPLCSGARGEAGSVTWLTPAAFFRARHWR
ncbi:hypothetical protein MJ584_22940 [Klebsiella pneumoniae]|nr:hypothetical protein MJ584_22940 [Klebsiella pneumoniae]